MFGVWVSSLYDILLGWLMICCAALLIVGLSFIRLVLGYWRSRYFAMLVVILYLFIYDCLIIT